MYLVLIPDRPRRYNGCWAQQLAPIFHPAEDLRCNQPVEYQGANVQFRAVVILRCYHPNLLHLVVWSLNGGAYEAAVMHFGGLLRTQRGF